MNREEIELQIWEYIDGTCSDADRQRISTLIATDDEWRQLHTELSELHSLTSDSIEAEQPSMRFTKNVMDAVAAAHVAPAARKYINTTVVKGIAALFIAVIIVAVSYALATTNWNTTSPSRLTNVNIPTLNITTYLTSTLFACLAGVSIILGLILVDTILRKQKLSRHPQH